MKQISFPEYKPPVGLSPFTQSTHFAQQTPVASQATGGQSLAFAALPHASTSPQPHFGFNRTLIRSAQAFDHFVSASRARELIIVDFGFSLIRTTMDLCRQFIYKNDTIGEKPKFNFSVARERFLLEMFGGFVGDTITGVTGGYLLGLLLEKRLNPYSNKFTDEKTMTFFNKALKGSTARTPEQLLQQIARRIAPGKAEKMTATLLQHLKQNKLEDAAVSLAKQLGQTQLDVKIGKETFSLKQLLSDFTHLNEYTLQGAKASSSSWRSTALKMLRKTNGINNIRFTAAVAIGLLFNFASPAIIQQITRKVDHLDDYPGEMGLRPLQSTQPSEAKTFSEKVAKEFPYLVGSLKQGNILPLLAGLPFLPIAFGLVNSNALQDGAWHNVWNNPFKKGFITRLKPMLQFSKSFPFASAGFIPMIYSATLAARIFNARSAVEFRERTVDSYMAWTTFILATPWFKKWAAKYTDKHYGTQLMKKVGTVSILKNETEVLKLIKNPVIRKKSMEYLALISTGSTLATILLLGLIEPLLSIKLTEWQSRRENKRQAFYH